MIYVASSWRNALYDGIIHVFRAAGLAFYDFKHPRPGLNTGFGWHRIDPAWQQWSRTQYRDAMTHPLAEEGFAADIEALKACDRLVLVLPCGRSAHIELGIAIGLGKETFILMTADQEPELLYKAADHLCLSVMELLGALGVKD